jgi:hypothetical protein
MTGPAAAPPATTISGPCLPGAVLALVTASNGTPAIVAKLVSYEHRRRQLVAPSASGLRKQLTQFLPR